MSETEKKKSPPAEKKSTDKKPAPKKGFGVVGIISLVLLGVIAVGAGYVASFRQADIPAAVVDAKYASAESRFLYLPGGGRIHYRDQGAKNGSVIVLLHGSNASLHAWEKWVARLKDDYRIITLDFPAHGLSGAWPSENYSLGAYVSMLRYFTQALGLEHFTLGGNSMGGHVSWRYALAWPEQIESLILVNASGWPDLENETPPLIFRLMAREEMRALFQTLYIPSFTESGVYEAYNGSPVVDDALIDRYHELNLREGQRRASALRFAGNLSGARIAPPAGVLTMPALIMWGDKDTLINVKRAEDFARILPNSVVVVYEDVGHVPMEEIPDRSAADLFNFLSGVIRVDERLR